MSDFPNSSYMPVSPDWVREVCARAIYQEKRNAWRKYRRELENRIEEGESVTWLNILNFFTFGAVEDLGIVKTKKITVKEAIAWRASEWSLGERYYVKEIRDNRISKLESIFFMAHDCPPEEKFWISRYDYNMISGGIK